MIALWSLILVSGAIHPAVTADGFGIDRLWKREPDSDKQFSRPSCEGGDSDEAGQLGPRWEIRKKTMEKIKVLTGIAGVIFVALFSVRAQDPLTNGLVAYYPFNGNANDASGNGNHATPAGNFQFLTNGLSVGAIRIVGDFSQFYAGGGHVLLPAFDASLNSGFTCSLWVKDEVIGVEPVGAEFYVGFASGAADGAFNSRITLNNWSPAFVGFANGNGSGTGVDFRYTIDMATHPTSWKHLVMATTPGRFSCYLNGSKIYETNVSYGAVFPAPLSALGRHWWPSGSSARMSITYDNVRIYNRALSDSEIQQLYAYEGFQLTNGLVAYYPFNGDANDESGNGNNASVSGAVLTVDRFGVTNKAFHFNGAGDNMSASVASIPLGNSPRTIVAWFKPDDSSLINGIIHHGRDDCTGLMFGLSRGRSYLGNDNLGFWGGCRDYASSLIIPSNQWSFVALTYDGSSIRLYANGQSETNGIGPLNTQNSRLWIGAETLNDGGSFRDFFKGSIDDIRIYNRALSTEEAAQLYANESGPRVSLIKAVKPSFSGLSLGTNYQLQVSGDLNNWTNQGSAFTATNTGMIYSQYWDVDNWGQLFFRLQVSP